MKKINKSDTTIKTTKNLTSATSRARFRCPVTLGRVIELLNLISAETVENYKGLKELEEENKNARWLQIFGKLPVELKNYIKDFVEFDSPSSKAERNFYYEYRIVFENLLAVRALLASLESFVGDSLLMTNKNLPYGEMSAEQSYSFHSVLKCILTSNALEEIGSPNYSGLINVEILTNFTVKLTLSPLLYVIGKADIRRIRQCRFCRNLFWAERNDALGCSRRCSNALRQRKLRDKKKDSNG